jgi:glycosyltransferase involved in cell wall biosynthesis
MKVAFLSPSAQLGGAERILLDIFASLRTTEPGWTLHLIANDEGPLVDRASALGGVEVSVVRFPEELARLGDAGIRGTVGDRVPRRVLIGRLLSSSPAVVGYLRQLRKALAAVAPHVVHTNGFKMHVLGTWAVPRRLPIVWHVHDYVSSRPVMSRLLRMHARRCSLIVANSRSVADDVRRVCGDRVRVEPVYNGVDLETFSPDGETLDLEALSGLPRPEGPVVRVGLVGTLGRWKGHAVFLRALARLSPDLPFRGYVVGGALYQTGGSQYSLDDLRELARSLGLEGRVGFTGFVEEPAAAMRALDVVVHASTQPEPFGLVIAEAMGCSRALIASQAGGSAELFTGGHDAVGYPPGDEVALAAHIERLVNDPGLRQRLGQAGRQSAERRFDRRRLAAELVPLYTSLAPVA